MTNKQLSQISRFAKKYYLQINDPFHPWEHATLTYHYARQLASDYKNVNLKVLEAACLLHDIGRINKDQGHPEESAKLAHPFLLEIGLSPKEAGLITHAIEIHDKERIHEAQTLEAKLLFDADKLQILSVYGFIKVWMWLVEKRKMGLVESLDFLWDYVKSVYYQGFIQTPQAKAIMSKEMVKIARLIADYKMGLNGLLK